MTGFNSAETAACRRLVEWALEEDLGQVGDLTSQAVIPFAQSGRAVFVARQAGVLAGVDTIGLVMTAVYSEVIVEPLLADGTALTPGDRIATVAGPMVRILAGERTALNFVQRLSGVATQTRRYVDAVAGLPCHILDTRKTTPGWRLLEKYAVRCGGGHNHRRGLYDGILIKDNHLAALGQGPAVIAHAVAAVRQKVGDAVAIEVEVDTPEQLTFALDARPNLILLDNMTLDQLREAVRRRDQSAPGVQLEASGGVTLATTRAIAETGVDRVSVGALTHSAPALDIALDYEGPARNS
jgi:nicotinate-nucleotide pyrophosphorylase (carboxylating)